MSRFLWPVISLRAACCLLAVLTASGCAKPKAVAPSVSQPQQVRLTQPQVRTIKRVVGQPSFVEAYERTSIYPKVTAYIEKWKVDIGDKVKKGDLLATLFVPELREDLRTKQATVKLDEKRVALNLKLVDVAEAEVQAADARVLEAKKILGQYQAQVDRWDSEVKRLQRETEKGVVAPQILLESQDQWKRSISARDAATATIQKTQAELLAKKAALEESKLDVEVARARVVVADSDAKRMEAWVGYLTLTAPFDGVIVARNANTSDFVLPGTGDPSADKRAPDLSPGNKAAPIYVVDRTDIVRVFVDIPEQDANYVQIGTKASVRIQGYRDQWISAAVTRNAWALNIKSRTLRAEIDLKNTDHKILPGMYAYGKVHIERPKVLALPAAALVSSGDSTFYWSYENGHATRIDVQTGASDGEWVEITSRQGPAKSDDEESWVPLDGSEQVILGDLSTLTDGAAVRLTDQPATPGETARSGKDKSKEG